MRPSPCPSLGKAIRSPSMICVQMGWERYWWAGPVSRCTSGSIGWIESTGRQPRRIRRMTARPPHPTSDTPVVSSATRSEWTRATYAGLASGVPSKATFHVAVTLANGQSRHLVQTVQVIEDELLLRLARLSPGTDV